ncbi:hypothetical protein [Acinetobacter ursingii]|uniref:hypothetical protein n=1 Tax=Acinetobacter ursingii TaxID=108980 RepID=UPI00254AC819|nr:hypothetical protein [Acinetobacter ursingii]MEC6128318.1 hypothetical protein [Acinetobacter ursingii]
MKFAELIDQSRPDNNEMAAFTTVILHNLANNYSSKKLPEYQADLINNKDYTKDYVEAQLHISENYKIPPLMVSLVAALWNKNLFDYLSKHSDLASYKMRFSECGLFDMVKSISQKKDHEKKYYVSNRDRLVNKIYSYDEVFTELVEDVYMKGYTFGLDMETDSESESEMIALLNDYLDFNLFSIRAAKKFLIEN